MSAPPVTVAEDDSILQRIDAQQQRIDRMELTQAELDGITRGRTFLYTTGASGLTIGTLAGYIISMGRDSGRLAKLLVCGGTGLAGLALGAAFGVQTVMQSLHSLDSPLGAELQALEGLRMRLRRRGAQPEGFTGSIADAERERLNRLFHSRTKGT